IGVLIFGKTINNAKSWFSLGPANIQPAEFAKLGIILYLASVYSKKQDYINDFSRGVLPPLILTGVILGLIVLQPDIGTAGIILIISCSVILSSGIKITEDRKSTRLNSSHVSISYAVFCLKKKNNLTVMCT